MIDVAIGVNDGVASFLSWSKFQCNPETGIMSIRGRPKLLPPPPFKGEHLNGRRQASVHLSPLKRKPLGSHMVGYKHPIHLDTPTTIGWTIGGRVHQKSSVGKVNHPSTIMALGGLTLEFSWDPMLWPWV